MVCDEKVRLITAYAGSTERYAIAVAKLGLSTNAEFDKAFIGWPKTPSGMKMQVFTLFVRSSSFPP
jgi:hypothetical protein